MKRALVIASLVMASCGKSEPPPDPICAKVMSAYDTVSKTLMTLTKGGWAGDTKLACMKLELGVRGADSLVPSEYKTHLKPALDALEKTALQCVLTDIKTAQQKLADQLVSLRATVAAECAK